VKTARKAGLWRRRRARGSGYRSIEYWKMKRKKLLKWSKISIKKYL